MTDLHAAGAGAGGEPTPPRVDPATSGGRDDESRHPARWLRRVLRDSAEDPAPAPGSEAHLPEDAFEPEEAFEPGSLLFGSADAAPPSRWARRISPRTLVAGLALVALVAGAGVSLLLPSHPRSSPPVAAVVPSPTALPLLPAPPIRPSARDDAAMAYDPAVHSVILFGGLAFGGLQGLTALSDTWSWDGTAWIELSPAISPPGLSGALLGYDATTERLVLTGGAVTSARGELEAQDSTWTWDGSTWTAQPAGALPATDLPTAVGTDAAGQLILVTTRSGCAGVDTWRWTGASWLKLHPATSPPPSSAAGMAYDPQTGQLDLFPAPGGCGGTADLATTAPPVWSWDGATWQSDASPTGTVLTGSWQLATSAAGPLLVTSGQTYLWSGAAGAAWDDVSVSPAIGDSSVAYDAADEQVVLFGGICASCDGTSVADTWTWNGSWTLQNATPSPPA